MRKAVAIALAIALWPAVAGAQSVKSVLEEFGLLHGSWAPDCSNGPSTSNWYGRYRMMPNGEARLTYSSKKSSSGDNVYLIKLARRLSDKEILLAEEFVREKRALEVVLSVEGDRYHTISVKRADGSYLVKDGKYADGDEESPWLERCR
jgi:hypothetical protein